ncbi:hypothetical protein VTK73DRAFT_1908 [Phialemonium thermophilum]|uniref:Prolyl 4-hydroxylase alpha subunit domain-containing protein n=1 Tax=Phialemonium thermophilum TaxID=223376 RepID=A0ABR3Y3P5_9PEZI
MAVGRGTRGLPKRQKPKVLLEEQPGNVLLSSRKVIIASAVVALTGAAAFLESPRWVRRSVEQSYLGLGFWSAWRKDNHHSGLRSNENSGEVGVTPKTKGRAAANDPWSSCPPHAYTTELISMDPLLIYIHDFVSLLEAAAIIDIGTPLLQPSPLTGYGTDVSGHQARTSWSAPLPVSSHPHPSTQTPQGDKGFRTTTPTAVDCVLGRARSFLGTLLVTGRDDMGAPQMVRYMAGQRFDVHTDWFARPRVSPEDAAEGRRRMYNRVATLFVVLQNNATEGGETWFPRVGPIPRSRETDALSEEASERVWRMHEDGGLAFRPIPGNAMFWVNLFPNGTGDSRVVHAGLPIKDGVKTGMNIWPRAYFGPDA